ncbi:MAG: GntR family transcriptional regulator [Chloroflexi bacterium]|nr:GntR family transcriptional regulator [Chloroflexota bacterium]
MLDRNSPVPLYIQFKEFLLTNMRNGTYPAGHRLPSVNEFCKKFNVSRITIRQALDELMRDGLIQGVPGVGTFVAQEIEQEFHLLSSFSQQMEAQGRKPTTQVLRAIKTQATAVLANLLHIPIHSPVALIERLRYADDEPWILQTAYLPLKYCPGILNTDLSQNSLYKTLSQQYQLNPVDAEYRFEARLASPGEAQLLEVIPPAAVLTIRQTSFLDDGNPIEYTRSIYRANLRFHSYHGLTAGEPENI